jgi:hypothetical protein
MQSMTLKRELNSFEIEVYLTILKYWEDILGHSINFSSKKDKRYIKHLNLLPEDFLILKEINKHNEQLRIHNK